MKRTPVAYIAVEILITIPNLLSKRFLFFFYLKKPRNRSNQIKQFVEQIESCQSLGGFILCRNWL